MGKKNIRIHTLIEIIKNHNVGSQEELLKLLEKEGISVTQATLSRDLKMLKTSKVPLEHGEYAYMLPDALTIKKPKRTPKERTRPPSGQRIHIHRIYGQSRGNAYTQRIRIRNRIRY